MARLRLSLKPVSESKYGSEMISSELPTCAGNFTMPCIKHTDTVVCGPQIKSKEFKNGMESRRVSSVRFDKVCCLKGASVRMFSIAACTQPSSISTSFGIVS